MTRAPAAEIADQVTASDVALYREYAAQGIRMFPADTLRLLTALDAATARAEEAERERSRLYQAKRDKEDRATAAEAEAARLREALEEIRNDCPPDHGVITVAHQMAEIAAAALAPTPPATVAPEGPSEATAGDAVATEVFRLIYAIQDTPDREWLVQRRHALARALDRLAGRGRA